jgi:predicted nicotinamide N-methyase
LPANFTEIKIGDYPVRYISPGNAYDLFEELIQKNPSHADVIDERVPYWADLWPSAIALGQYIAQESKNISGKNIIEIGCGLGIPGIVAGIAGGNVTMSDYLQEALTLACENWKLNLNTECKWLNLDWRKAYGGEKFELVLASDIAYEKKSFFPVVKILKELLVPGGSVFLSEPNRPYAAEFINLLSTEFDLTDIRDYIIRKNDIDYKVSVYKLKNTK